MATLFARLLVVPAFLIGLLAAMPAPANAGPNVKPTVLYGCASWIPGSWANYSIAYCKSGSGYYRAVAYCQYGGTGPWLVRYGSWQFADNSSYANCLSGERIVAHSYQTTT